VVRAVANLLQTRLMGCCCSTRGRGKRAGFRLGRSIVTSTFSAERSTKARGRAQDPAVTMDRGGEGRGRTRPWDGRDHRSDGWGWREEARAWRGAEMLTQIYPPHEAVGPRSPVDACWRAVAVLGLRTAISSIF
jgi:hypothetical protein